MANLQLIVDSLNRPPFEKDLTLVSFDEKNSFELLSLLNDVLAHLDKRHKIDIRDEPQNVTVDRMTDFFKLLKYPLPAGHMEEFQHRLIQGSRSVVYPLLHYLLSNIRKLEKRAYLARFLVNIEVPQQFMLNPDVANVYQQYKHQRQEFAETHKTVDRLRQTSLAPGELRKEIVQLEEEKHQLQDKIGSLKQKTVEMSGFKNILKVTSALRHEQEVEAKLQEQTMEQQQALEISKQRLQQTENKLQSMRAFVREGSIDPGRLVERLRNEVAEISNLVCVTLPQKNNEAHEKFSKVHRSLSEPARGKSDVMEIQAVHQRLRGEVESLKQKINYAESKRGDDPLAVFKQQASIPAKKREQKEAKLQSAEAAHRRLQDKLVLIEKQSQTQAKGNPHGIKDFKAFAKSLRSKTEQYKKMKKEMGGIQAESVVLSRTVAILKSRCSNIEEVLAKLEKTKRVLGYTATQDSLHHISSATAALNSTKGKTLEEISKIVTDISHRVNEKRKKFQPLVDKVSPENAQYGPSLPLTKPERFPHMHSHCFNTPSTLQLLPQCSCDQLDANTKNWRMSTWRERLFLRTQPLD